MKKYEIGKDTYFVGENGNYLEIKNVKEYIDIDGIKRYLVEIKDINKINMLKRQSNGSHKTMIEDEKDEDIGKDRIEM